jgi:3D (Asp-Asp-Asp) domain-containing protein
MPSGATLTTLSRRLPIGLMVLLVCAAGALMAADWWYGVPAKSVDPNAALDLMAVESPAKPATFAVVPVVAPTKSIIKSPAPAVAEALASVDLTSAVVIEPAAPAVSSDDVVYYNGRPMRQVKTLDMLVTAYSPDEQSCGPYADGITASGYSIWTNGMKLAAADTSMLPFGTVITVPGYNDGNPIPVLDRGGAIKGNRLDVLYPTHNVAMKWGRQHLKVVVWEYADE